MPAVQVRDEGPHLAGANLPNTETFNRPVFPATPTTPATPAGPTTPAAPTTPAGPAATGEEVTVTGGLGLREQISRRYQESGDTNQRPGDAEAAPVSRSDSDILCPECGSNKVKRRPRSSIERALLSLTEHKAYTCRNCQASFYFRGDSSDQPASIAKSGDAARA